MLAWFSRKLLEKTDGRDVNQYLAVFTAGLTYITCGLHFGWTIPSLPKLISEERYNVSQDEGSYIAIISSLGHVIGGLSGSLLIDKIGRKRAILSIAIPQFLGFFLTYCSIFGKNWLYGARILGGIGEGASLALTPTYIAEVTDPKLRGTCGTIIGFFFPIGSILVTLLGSYLDIPTTALICLFFPLLFVLTFSLMPESPYYLLMRNRTKEAEHSLKILRRSEKVEKELVSLTMDVDRQMSETGTYKDLFIIPTNRKALLLVVFIRFFQQFSGATAISTYSQLLIIQTTDFSPIIGSIIFQVLGLLINIPTYFLIDRVGRLLLIKISVLLMFVILTVLGTYFLLQDYFYVDTSSVNWIPLVLMVLFIGCFGLGCGIVVTIFICEIFSSSIKSKALGINSIVFAGSMMGSVKLYQFTADNFSKAVPFYIFAFICLLNIIFTFNFLPETKGKTLEMIQQELRKDKTTSS